MYVCTCMYVECRLSHNPCTPATANDCQSNSLHVQTCSLLLWTCHYLAELHCHPTKPTVCNPTKVHLLSTDHHHSYRQAVHGPAGSSLGSSGGCAEGVLRCEERDTKVGIMRACGPLCTTYFYVCTYVRNCYPLQWLYMH